MRDQLLMKTEIRFETDVVAVRRKAREIAASVGFNNQDQIRIATAVSEIARNAFEYAKGGVAEFSIDQETGVTLNVVVRDRGPGIKAMEEIEQGTYISPQGMGLGIIGAKKLMDSVKIETGPQGTTVRLRKLVPGKKAMLTQDELNLLLNNLMIIEDSPINEVQRQNKEILVAMNELTEKGEELFRMNQELEDTNRGVVALYAELDEKAEILRKANESKTSFLSDMTHEFRSPLNSILGISQILLDEARLEKSTEREKQVGFIMKAARGLSDLVNDLLDIAKIEAGKISLKKTIFEVDDVMSSLRGLMRPIGGHENVRLTFLTHSKVTLETDEGKLTQILRNLISNGLKYTLEGEVLVEARKVSDELISFTVTDTGHGISEEHQVQIFEEFFQVENAEQARSKGTGLGLPLSRKLARLLGGTITVASELGKGSVFELRIPIQASGELIQSYETADEINAKSRTVTSSKTRVLIVDDEPSFRYLLKSQLSSLHVDIREAQNGREAIEVGKVYLPDIIVLDLVMPVLDGMGFIQEAMSVKALRDVPIVLHSSKELEAEEKIYFEQVTSGIVPKLEHSEVEVKNVIAKMIGTKS